MFIVLITVYKFYVCVPRISYKLSLHYASLCSIMTDRSHWTIINIGKSHTSRSGADWCLTSQLYWRGSCARGKKLVIHHFDLWSNTHPWSWALGNDGKEKRHSNTSRWNVLPLWAWCQGQDEELRYQEGTEIQPMLLQGTAWSEISCPSFFFFFFFCKLEWKGRLNGRSKHSKWSRGCNKRAWRRSIICWRLRHPIKLLRIVHYLHFL